MPRTHHGMYKVKVRTDSGAIKMIKVRAESEAAAIRAVKRAGASP